LGAYMGGYHWARIVIQPVLLVIFMVCGVLLPAVSLHFFLIFPRPKSFLQRHPWKTGLVIYGVPLVFLGVLVAGYLRIRWSFPSTASWWEDLAGTSQTHYWEELAQAWYIQRWVVLFYLGVAGLWYLASVFCLIHSFRVAGNHTE